jgi:hypothetical protein
LEELRTAGPPFGANGIASYGVLKLLPFWDPLRGDPLDRLLLVSGRWFRISQESLEARITPKWIEHRI